MKSTEKFVFSDVVSLPLETFLLINELHVVRNIRQGKIRFVNW